MYTVASESNRASRRVEGQEGCCLCKGLSKILSRWLAPSQPHCVYNSLSDRHIGIFNQESNRRRNVSRKASLLSMCISNCNVFLSLFLLPSKQLSQIQSMSIGSIFFIYFIYSKTFFFPKEHRAAKQHHVQEMMEKVEA